MRIRTYWWATAFSAAMAISALPAGAQDREGGPGPGDRGGMLRFNPVLAALDTNEDGEISAEEIDAATAALKTLDADGDGKITGDEQKKMQEDRRKIVEERRAEMIKRFDKDGDGQLSEEERKAMPRYRDRPGRPERPEAKPEKKADDTVE